MKHLKSYTSPKVKVKESKLGGKGLFAKEKIKKGKIIIDYTKGPGKFLSAKEAGALYKKGNDYMIQVDHDTFFGATNKDELEVADFVNHSCDPNCGIKGKLRIVAMRDIDKGEEVAFDYAMTESSDYAMKCKCKSAYCRGVIHGDDWKLKDLQKRYNGFFSDYLQKKISSCLPGEKQLD